MKKYKRILVLILDSVGCGIQSDYKKFHNLKANTLGTLYSKKSFSLPNLEKMGIDELVLDEPEKMSKAIFGKMIERTMGNDTFAGVWEMMGIIFKKRFRSKKMGFSKKVTNKIENVIGVPIVGNEYISGFKALDKYYDAHKKTNSPIIYLADDGVVLFAAHESVIAADKLNEMARMIGPILREQNISRIITRPFVGKKYNFIRTDNRRDFVLINNTKHSLIEQLKKMNIKFLTTEHLYNILSQPSNVDYIKGNHNNEQLLRKINKNLREIKDKAIMLFCLQDFDMYGHRKDIDGYAKKLISFDKALPNMLNNLNDDDLLIITADHGCDPGLNIRGHTREFVPCLIYSKNLEKIRSNIGDRKSFSDIGQTICYNYSLPKLKNGKVIYEIF